MRCVSVYFGQKHCRLSDRRDKRRRKSVVYGGQRRRNGNNLCRNFRAGYVLRQVCRTKHVRVLQVVRNRIAVGTSARKVVRTAESFNHFNSTYGYQCAAYGVLGKTHVYLLPEEPREVQSVYENYIVKNLFKRPDGESKYVFKVFGLAKHDVETRLEKINPFVDRKCESANLDSKITLCFPSKTSKQVVSDTLTAVKQMFADNLYATTDKTISETVVELMESLGKKMSTAESMTGGLIASNIVDNSGASNVLYEGIVCYSVASKCARLGINPHFVDEYGVVSAEVAQAMSRGLLANGSDVAVSITGYAGPSSAPEYPVGLCYISVASTKTGVAVYRNLFRGDRNSIRQQAANMALFLVYKTFVK